MKKVLLLYGLLVIVLVGFLLFRGGKFPNLGFGSSATVKINNKTYKLIVAKTTQDQIKGLSGKESLAKDTGMLFVFKDKGIYPFWMKNMKFPIDIIFINDNIITDIFENSPTPTPGQTDADLPKYKPSQDINYVLELNANEVTSQAIKKGDKITLNGIK